MLPAVWLVMRTYAPYVTLPFAVVFGYVGYNLERTFRTDRDKTLTYLYKSVRERREERIIEEEAQDKSIDLLKEKRFVPKSVLDVNPVGKGSGFL